MYGKANYIKENQLRYDSFSQKYHGTSGQVHIVFDGIFPHCITLVRISHGQRANYQASISVSEYSKPWLA